MMKSTTAFKVQFDDQLAGQMQDILERKINRIGGKTNAPNVASEISASGASLKITIKGQRVLRDEFGTLRQPARPWVANLIHQAAPLLRQVLVARFKPTK